MSPPSKRFLLIAMAAMAFVIGALALWKSSRSGGMSAVEKSDEAIRITAKTLHATFDNTPVMREQFRGRTIHISGSVYGAEPEIATVLVDTGTDVPVRVVTRTRAEASATVIGMPVTADCSQADRIGRSMVLKGCRLR